MALTSRQLLEATSYNVRVFGTIFDEPPGWIYKEFWTGVGQPDPSTPAYAEIVARAQEYLGGLVIDGKHGPSTDRRFRTASQSPGTKFRKDSAHTLSLLTSAERTLIVGFTKQFEGGREDPYAGMNLDGEFKGLFDHPRTGAGKKRLPPDQRALQSNHDPHRASKFHPGGGFHIGLSFGAWQAAQEPGSLGQLLKYMWADDPDLFTQIFFTSHELLATTNAKGKRQGRRSPRTQPVGGADLWREPWVGRFKRAAKETIFRHSQRRWVADAYLDPAIKIVAPRGMQTRADLAVAFDIAIQFGVGGLRKRAKKIPAGEWSEGKLDALIATLPKRRRQRRERIAEAAGHSVHFLLD
jgi:hypothetical protein